MLRYTAGICDLEKRDRSPHTIDKEDRRTIAILCDEIEAEKLLFTAEVLHLNAARDIASALDPLREL